jgi:glutamate-1-semialdehyde aminotransferase
MVEPIQSRRPDFQPREFLHALRDLTTKCGAALIFDEVITGFRLHPRGAQGYFGVRADIASYGKVVGGGMPIGVIAGQRPWIDALDGGSWAFGDTTVPEVGVTYFAGTFVRHPLALAAAKATLEHLKAEGPKLQSTLNQRMDAFAAELNQHFESVKLPLKIKHFGSLFKAICTEDVPFGDLMFCWLRSKGLHIWDGFPCFFTTAHSDADIKFIVKTFKDTIKEMQDVELLPANAATTTATKNGKSDKPPVPGAKLGRDPNGFPAWYVADPSKPGQFIKVGDA